MSWREKTYDVLPALSVRGKDLRQSLRLVTVAWMWGVVWMTCVSGDQMRAFAKMLGFNDFAFGLMGAIPFLATLGQLPAAIVVERTGLRKYLFLNCQIAARLLWLPIALVPLVIFPGPSGSVLAVVIVLTLMDTINAEPDVEQYRQTAPAAASASTVHRSALAAGGGIKKSRR